MPGVNILSMRFVFVICCLFVSVVGFAQTVPLVDYSDPVAGFNIKIPQDWSVSWGRLGQVMMSIDGDSGLPSCSIYPALIFMRGKEPGNELAQGLAKVLKLMHGTACQVRKVGANNTWEVTTSYQGQHFTMKEHWLCRGIAGQSFAIGAVGSEKAMQDYANDVKTGLESCKLIPRIKLQRFLEPTENAYRMVFPTNWKWTGKIIRAQNVPGTFEWKTQNANQTAGAFNAPVVPFNIATPWMTAADAARDIIMPALGKQIAGIRLDKIQELPRVGAYYEQILQIINLSNNPQISKCRADYLGSVNGVNVRMRLTIGTFMLGSSELLGGRGNWMMFVSGAWAPVDKFSTLYPQGRGVIASFVTDEIWANNQFEAGSEAAWAGAMERDIVELLRQIYELSD